MPPVVDPPFLNNGVFDSPLFDNPLFDSALFDAIANDVYQQGYSVQPNAVPLDLAQRLYQHVTSLPFGAFEAAGIGRQGNHQQNATVRGDQIHWISEDVDVEAQWLAWAAQLQNVLNRRLFLGLFSFESHFAHYRKGDFYKRHLDAFKGQANRTVSLVVYLNPQWQKTNAGELVLYRDAQDQQGIKVTPHFATAVVFLSEEFPHEVLPVQCDRYSIAGWFRINSTDSGRIDPPR